jgi:hypothetical protein
MTFVLQLIRIVKFCFFDSSRSIGDIGYLQTDAVAEDLHPANEPVGKILGDLNGVFLPNLSQLYELAET